MPHNELFLGGLSKDIRRQDLEETFGKYGKITRCDIKYVNGRLKLNKTKHKNTKYTNINGCYIQLMANL